MEGKKERSKEEGRGKSFKGLLLFSSSSGGGRRRGGKVFCP